MVMTKAVVDGWEGLRSILATSCGSVIVSADAGPPTQ